MDKKESEFILQEGEGLKMEFKESFDSKGLGKEIVAFANSEGGMILLGVNDESEKKGIKVSNRLKSQIQDIANNCDLSININIMEFGNILIIEVEEGKDKPYKCGEGFYLRQGPNSQKMSREQILSLAVDEGRIKFDSQINNEFDFKKDFNENKLDDYLKLTGIKKNIDVKDILFNLGVAIKEDNEILFNNVGVLFFAINPSKFFLSSKVICVNYQTNEKVNILDKKVFDEGIIGNILESINYVKKHINVEYIIKKLEREEVSQYPEEAIREAVVNAVVHRDYASPSKVQIRIFDDYLEIWNPGELPEGWTVEKLKKKHESIPKNPLLFKQLFWVKYVEDVGGGTIDMISRCKEWGIPEPEFEFTGTSLVSVFRKNVLTEEYFNSLGLNEQQKKALEYISEKDKITRNEYERIYEVHERQANRELKQLLELGLIEKQGSGYNVYYVLSRQKMSRSVAEKERSSLSEEKLIIKEGLNVRQKSAIEYVKNQGKITNREYRKISGTSHKTAHVELIDLVDKGILKQIGKGRSVIYKVR